MRENDCCNASAAEGFTLLELAVVLLIIGLVTAMAVSSGISVIATARQVATQEKMRAIEKALQAYREVADRLPCPADLTVAEGATNFGIEGVSPGTCTGGTPAANFSASGVTNTSTTSVEGALPVVTLGLPNDFMYDGWGHRFRYAVDKDFTATGAFTSIVSGCNEHAITVNDALGSSRSTGAVYAVVSQGENGHGGYTKTGAPVSVGSTNANELINCHCSNTGATTTVSAVQTLNPATYVQAQSSLDTTDALKGFDDIVTYKERWQMMAAWEKPQACGGYIYVMDTYNNRVQKFSTKGTYISQMVVAASNGNTGLAIDAGGNVYTCDWNHNVLTKFDPSGVKLLEIGAGFNGVAGAQYTGGTDNGQLAGSWSVAVDASGNIWVTEIYNHRVQEYNSSGVWVRSIGGPSPHTCQTTPAGSIPACANGNGDGQLDTPEGGIAFDAGGNLWVGDFYNDRVQKFTSTGGYQSQIGGYGQGNGQFIRASGIAFDSGGNIWVVDAANNRVQKFSSAGVWQASLGGTSSPCTECLCTGPATCPSTYGGTYSGQGQFNGPGSAIAIDSDDNIWVPDVSNNRVQKFSSTGTYLMSIGAGYNGVAGSVGSSGSGQGQFNLPAAVFFYPR